MKMPGVAHLIAQVEPFVVGEIAGCYLCASFIPSQQATVQGAGGLALDWDDITIRTHSI